MKKHISSIIIVVLSILQLYSFVKISNLQERIDINNSSIQSNRSQLQNQISSIYQNVDNKLEQQASLIKNASYEFGDLNIEMLEIPITFFITPKTISENTSIFLDLNGDLIPLQKVGTTYSTTANFNIFSNVFPSIIIEDNGVKKLEDNLNLRVGEISSSIFPSGHPRFSGRSSYGSNKYTMSGHIDFDEKPANADISFVEINFVNKVDGEIINRKPIPISEGMIKIEEKIPLNVGQLLTSYVVAVDNLGFTHEYLVEHFLAGAEAQREPYFEQKYIYAPNGELVYQFDETDYVEIN